MFRKLNIRKFAFSIFSLISFFYSTLPAPSLRHLINSGRAPQVANNILDLSNQGLSDLDGIENYPNIENVQSLIIRDNKISSLDPLEAISGVAVIEIDAASNRIKNLSQLRHFKNLEKLFLEFNQIDRDNFMIALNLSNLNFLAINGNPINLRDFRVYELLSKQFNNNFFEFHQAVENGEIDIDEIEEQQRLAAQLLVDQEQQKMENESESAMHESSSSSSLSSQEEDDEAENAKGYKCSICLSSKGEFTAAPCYHTFHQACLDRWLIESNKCPLCKETVIV